MGVAIGLAGALGVLGAFVPTASAATTVTCGSMISTAGTYALAANCTGGGITITASDVTLNLNGHTMTGTSTDFDVSIGVLVDGRAQSLSGVSIAGPGKIAGYSSGVALIGDDDSGVSASRVSGLTAANNRNYGIQTSAVSGITVSGNTVKRNTEGIYISYGSGDTVIGNTANNNQYDGIVIGGLSTGETVRGNTTNGNYDGITLANGSTDNTISGNTAQQNRQYDLVDVNDSCDHNVWTGNSFRTANQPCIH